ATHSVVCCVASGPGGHPLHVLLDTGTDPSAMDARLARRLALRTGGSGVGQGAASDEVPFTEAVLPWLRLGDLLIRDLFAPALDLGALPFRVDVVLGYNVLRQMALRIEYRTRRLVLAHPDVGIAVSPRAVSLPLVFFEHFPALMNINVEGRHIPLATIDTGSNGALSVGPDVANALGLRPSAVDVTHARGAGFGGESAVLRRCCRQLQLGPFDLGDVEVDAHLGMGGDLRRAGRVNIGNRLLSRFAAVSIDYQRGTIAFDPDPIVDCRL
ncbi:MAG TPA: aspartyl protease family protein, partial [Roseiflexaceae bacterium]|nr:aspartyl protease family protein [Roseiflexaceae bacterium]